MDKSVRQIVTEDLLNVVAVAIDNAALVGAGSSANQPLGICNMSSGSGYAFTNSVAVSSPFAWSDVLNCEYAPEAQNVLESDGTATWVTSPTVKKTLRSRAKIATTNTSGFIWSADSEQIGSHRALATNQLSVGPKANFAIYSPRWSELSILLAPAVSILVDPYTLASVFQSRVVVDVLVAVIARHACAFAITNQAIS